MFQMIDHFLCRIGRHDFRDVTDEYLPGDHFRVGDDKVYECQRLHNGIECFGWWRVRQFDSYHLVWIWGDGKWDLKSKKKGQWESNQ